MSIWYVKQQTVLLTLVIDNIAFVFFFITAIFISETEV